MSYPQFGAFNGTSGPPQMFGAPANNQGHRMHFPPRQRPPGPPRGNGLQQVVQPPQQYAGVQQNPLLSNIAPFSINPPQGAFFPQQAAGMEFGQNAAAAPFPPVPMPGFSGPRPPNMPYPGMPPMPGQPPNFRAVPPPAGPPTFLKDKTRPVRPAVYTAPPEVRPAYDPESVVTIFIGNIDERVSEPLMNTLIQKCGNVANWKRVQGANNKLQAFGFCDFYDAESALRAIRLLDKLVLGAKELQVKVGNKQHPLIIAYQNFMKGRLGPDAAEDAVDDAAKRKDQMLKREIDMAIEEYEEELSKALPEEKYIAVKRSIKADTKETIEEIEMEEDKRQLISREIQNFRETYKGSDEVLEERIKAQSQAQRRAVRDKETPDSNSARSTSVTSSSQKRPTRRSRSPSAVSSASSEEVVTASAKRRDMRRIQEQEKMYKELLVQWEEREEKKKRERKKDDEREKQRSADDKKTAKRLIRVYEDYDDDKMDGTYYSGDALKTLVKDRQKEMESDNKDREREAKMLEELKSRIIKDGNSAPEPLIKMELEESRHMISQSFRETLQPVHRDEPVSPMMMKQEEQILENVKMENHQSTSISFHPATSRIGKRVQNEVFGSDEEAERDEQGERRKRLFRNDEEAEKKRQMEQQKRAHAKKLIQSIPSNTAALFQYPLAWDLIDKELMEGRIKEWISKKIEEYIGEKEQTLVEFIAQKITTRSDPSGIVQDITMVLDEDAENFVVKLWRLLIYETEMKKSGLH